MLDKNDKLMDIDNTINERTDNYYDSTYQPGQVKEQLTPGLEVKKDTSSKEKQFHLQRYTTWGAGYTAGNFYINLGFKPEKIKFYADRGAVSQGFSIGTTLVQSGTIKNACVYQNGAFGDVFDTRDDVCIFIYDASSSEASVTSIDNTGFTLNLPNNNYLFFVVIEAEGYIV